MNSAIRIGKAIWQSCAAFGACGARVHGAGRSAPAFKR